MGIVQGLLERTNLQRKYFAIAKVKKLRELNQLPPKSQIPDNFRQGTIDLSYKEPDYRKTDDQEMKDEQADQMFYECINVLLKDNIFDTSDLALDFIKDKLSVQYFMTKAKIRVG